MSLKNSFKNILFYRKKHGLKRLIKLSFLKLWHDYINIKEVVFVFDLRGNEFGSINTPHNLIVMPYNSKESIPCNDIEQLIELKSREILLPFLDKFFGYDATFWLAKMDGKVVGLQWSLTGGFNGFYSLPIASNEAIFLAAEVFPAYRGYSIYTHMTHLTCLKLKENGISRIYFKVHVSNTSSLKSASKTKSRNIGTVRTIKILNKYITIWDKDSIKS